MMRRITALLTLLAILNLGIGCTHITSRSTEEIPEAGSINRQLSGVIDSIHSLKLKTGEKIRFELPGGRLEADSSVVTGVTKLYHKWNKKYGGDPVRIEIENVEKLYFKKPAPLLSALVTIGAISVFVGIIALIQAASFDLDLDFGSK